MNTNTATNIHRIERMTCADARHYIDEHGTLEGVLVGERVPTRDILMNARRGEPFTATTTGEFSAILSAFERRLRQERRDEGVTARIYRTIE